MKQLTSYIDRPNLKTARIITIISSLVLLATNKLILDLIGLGWIAEFSFTHVIAGLIQVWAYYLFSEYLKNFDLRKTIVMLYIIMGCMALSSIIPYIITHFITSYRLVYLYSFISISLFITNVATVALLYITGIKLISIKKDCIGGLSLTGKLFTMKATLIALSFVYYVYTAIRMYTSSYNNDVFMSNGVALTIINALAYILNIAVLVSILYIYIKAERYNKNIENNKEEGDDDIIKEINDIGTIYN